MNLDALRRDLTAKQSEARARFASVTETADKENRALTAEERTSVETLTTEATAIRQRIERAEADAAMGRAIDALVPAPTATATVTTLRAISGTTTTAFGAPRMLSLGQQFVAHDAYDFFRKGGHRSASAWRSPSAELTHPRLMAATLTSDPASGGDLIVPQYQAGIQPTLFRRPVVADLLASGTTDSNLITYMKEASFVNAADTVAEGAAKPESTLTFDAVSDPVRKIAHWLPVTEEMLEDVAQIQSYIDARLRLGIELAEEDQLLNGTAVAPDIVGLRNRVGLAADVAMATDTPADCIYKQIMAIFNSAFLMPDGIVINPANWQVIQLAKDTTGSYLGSGPFAAPQGPLLWGLRVVVTPIITAGTALVGAFASAAQVFRKGGIRVEGSNSHQDFFVKNLVALRCEERLALAVYRPGAFGECTGLT